MYLYIMNYDTFKKLLLNEPFLNLMQNDDIQFFTAGTILNDTI